MRARMCVFICLSISLPLALSLARSLARARSRFFLSPSLSHFLCFSLRVCRVVLRFASAYLVYSMCFVFFHLLLSLSLSLSLCVCVCVSVSVGTQMIDNRDWMAATGTAFETFRRSHEN